MSLPCSLTEGDTEVGETFPHPIQGLQGLVVMLGACTLLKALQSRSLSVHWITPLGEQKSLPYVPGSSRLQSGTMRQRVHTAAEEHDQHKESCKHPRRDTCCRWVTSRFLVFSRELVTP